MAEYIKREDMHSAIEKDTNFGWYTSDGSVAFSKSEVHEMLNTIPSADVAEVRHGEWKWRNGGECSECGFHNSNFDFNFCPNCGSYNGGKTGW